MVTCLQSHSSLIQVTVVVAAGIVVVAAGIVVVAAGIVVVAAGIVVVAAGIVVVAAVRQLGKVSSSRWMRKAIKKAK
jgi:hypothetical protein